MEESKGDVFILFLPFQPRASVNHEPRQAAILLFAKFEDNKRSDQSKIFTSRWEKRQGSDVVWRLNRGNNNNVE